MAAYVDGRFLNETDGSRTWMLKRPSDGAIWYSPNEGYPLGAQSNYLRVMSISCDGCNSIAAIETKCGNYVPAATQPTIPSCWCSFKETIIFLNFFYFIVSNFTILSCTNLFRTLSIKHHSVVLKIKTQQSVHKYYNYYIILNYERFLAKIYTRIQCMAFDPSRPSFH